MRILLIALTACLMTSRAYADVDSGPKPGQKVPPLKVLSVVGDEENKEIDAAKLRAKKPTLYLFIRADRWTRPIAKTMKVLDESVDKLDGDIKVVAVWLTDDKEKTKQYLPRAQEILKFDATTLALHPDLTTGPEHWGLNSDSDLTVVVANEQRVIARFGFVAPNERVVSDVLKELKKTLNKSAT
jgi:hypothetical protein